MIKKIFKLVRDSLLKDTSREELKHKKIETKKKTELPETKTKKQKVISNTPKRTEYKNSQSTKWTPNDFPVTKAEGQCRFYDFKLSNSILHAVADLNFKYCTPIQEEIFKHSLFGKDAIGRAQTGTGKTAAFLIIIILKLIKNLPPYKRSKGSPRVLILAPTRELVIQIENDAIDLAKYTKLKTVSVYGGMDYKKQINRVKGSNIDILVATPGRLIDFMGKKLIHLNKVEVLIIDEADRMLDMGFIPDIRRIVRNTPHQEKRQTLFFSATFSEDVKRLAQSWTVNAKIIEIEPEQLETDTVSQLNYIVSTDDKFKLLYNLLQQKEFKKVLLFSNRKDTARKIQHKLSNYDISNTLLSGDIDQRKRLNRLENFKKGKVRVLVATDVAGRGIHIEGISHVINYNLPEDAEDYVHRIGRTGRAGLTGISISFACEDDSFQIPNIEKYLGHKLELIHPEEVMLNALPVGKKTTDVEKKKNFTQKKKYSNKYRKPKPHKRNST